MEGVSPASAAITLPDAGNPLALLHHHLHVLPHWRAQCAVVAWEPAGTFKGR